MKFKSIWTAIANHFINYPETLIFEVVNEPYFELSADEMDALNTLIISTIRATALAIMPKSCLPDKVVGNGEAVMESEISPFLF